MTYPNDAAGEIYSTRAVRNIYVAPRIILLFSDSSRFLQMH